MLKMWSVSASLAFLTSCGGGDIPIVPVQSNASPTAKVSAEGALVTGNAVNLDGTTSSDPDGNQLTFSWTLQQKPVESASALTAPATAKTSFIPDVPGTYIVALVVSDGKVSSAKTETTLEVKQAVTPAFNAGTGYVVVEGGTRQAGSAPAQIQADGKILASGTISNGIYANPDRYLVRLNADGSVDTAFGTSGKILQVAGVAADFSIYFPKPQKDGKIVTDGPSRLNADGSKDSGFGPVDASPISGPIDDFTVRADGKILVSVNASGMHNIVRYSASGRLDKDFGSGGVVNVPAGMSNLAFLSNADFVTVRVVQDGTSNSRYEVARYTSDGVLRKDWGVDGKLTSPVLHGFLSGAYIAEAPDGKLIFATIVAAVDYKNGAGYAIARVAPNGTMDASFGKGGIVEGHIDQYWLQAVTATKDDKVYIAGQATLATGSDIGIMRFDGRGNPDATFGTAGMVRHDFGTYDSLTRLIVQPDGKLLGSGSIDSKAVIYRFLSNGALDK